MKYVAAALLLVTAVVAGQGVLEPAELQLREATGNPALIRRAEPLLEGQRDKVAVVVVTAETTTYALFGTSVHDEYEIGSLTKPMTGQLLADAVDREETTYDTRLGTLLDELEDSRVGRANLRSLATHRSGLSQWGAEESSLGRWFDETVLAGNVRAVSTDEMYRMATGDELATRGEFRYSNLGFALLGSALEVATKRPYDDLISQRIFQPLGMSETKVGRDSDRNQRRGFTQHGRRSAPWNLDAFAPAGGVRSTPGDMARWLRSLVDGTAIGAEALDAAAGDERKGTGLGWYTLTTEDDHAVVWKPGQTGGFASFAAVDRTAGVGLVVLANTATPFDDDLLRLLRPE